MQASSPLSSAAPDDRLCATQVADGYVPPEAPAQREASQPPAAPEAEADPEASPSTHDTTVKWQPGCVVSVQFAAEPLVGWLAVKAQMGEQDKGVRYVEMQKVCTGLCDRAVGNAM